MHRSSNLPGGAGRREPGGPRPMSKLLWSTSGAFTYTPLLHNSDGAWSAHLVDVGHFEARRTSSLQKYLSEISATTPHKLNSKHCSRRSERSRKCSSRLIVQPGNREDSPLSSSATQRRLRKRSRNSMAQSCGAGRSRSTKPERAPHALQEGQEVSARTCLQRVGRRGRRAAAGVSADENAASEVRLSERRRTAVNCCQDRGRDVQRFPRHPHPAAIVRGPNLEHQLVRSSVNAVQRTTRRPRARVTPCQVESVEPGVRIARDEKLIDTEPLPVDTHSCLTLGVQVSQIRQLAGSRLRMATTA